MDEMYDQNFLKDGRLAVMPYPLYSSDLTRFSIISRGILKIKKMNIFHLRRFLEPFLTCSEKKIIQTKLRVSLTKFLFVPDF